MTQNITIFKNIQEIDTPFYKDLEFVLDRIKNGASKEKVKDIRKEKNKNERNDLKKKTTIYLFQW